MQSKFLNDVSLVREAINNDRLIVFAGAGVSKDSGIPLWGELIDEVKKYLNESTYESDALKIAQMLYNEKGEKEYNEILKKLIYKSFQRYNELHEVIFDLKPQHIITTNYDNCFEEVINVKGLPYSIVSKDIDLPYAKFKNLLIKYHGDFENHNIVFKEDDYLNFNKDHTLKEIFVKSLFSNKIILFIGYRVADVNLKILIKDIQYILKKHHQRAYLLNHNEEISESEIKYYENLGVNIIKLDKQSIIEKDNTNLSPTGKKVYSLIKYISTEFNINLYRNSITNIITDKILVNELYKSLNRFYYFRRLPKYIISNLYPINKNTNWESNGKFSGQYLITENNQLYDFLEKYEGCNDERYDKETLDNINYCITRLIASGFNYLVLNVNRKQMTTKNIDLTSKLKFDDSCDCINCSLDDYDFSSTLNKMNVYEITNQTTLWDDLVYSYGQYRVCDYYKSYISFKQIEIKANQLKVMEVSFLAKYNMKRLEIALMQNLFFNKYENKELRSILEESQKIDLEEELTRVKYFVDDEVYSFLKEIKDGIFIQKLCNDIDQEVVNISENLKKIEKGGFRSDNSVENLYTKTATLYAFLNDNFILGNGFSLIEYSFKKSLNTFIIAYYIGTLELDRDQRIFGLSHLKQFNSLLLTILIEKAEWKELHREIQERKLINIKIGEDSIIDIFNWILNFLKSPVGQYNNFSKNFSKNNIFNSYALKNKNFRNKQTRIFENICLIIAYFNFNSEQVTELFRNINIFIKYQDVNYLLKDSNIKYIVKNKYKIIDSEVLIEMLNILTENNIYNDEYLMINDALKQKKIKYTNDNFNVEYFDFYDRESTFVQFYNTLNKETKIKLKEKLKSYLQNNNNIEFYFFALQEKILTDKKTKEVYKSEIKEYLEQNNQNNSFKKNCVDFYILQYYFLVNTGIISKIDIDEEAIVEVRYKFLNSPQTFDIEKLNINWLKMFNWDIFLLNYAMCDTIFKKLESYLTENFDKELSEIYFKMLKHRNSIKIMKVGSEIGSNKN
ncbi:hypothetical protein HNP24_001853 [Chryseobacterium sediminis]|uniref:SIR2-like domain-containing protein n=1 Tax=Chryseobacterium sediminis TaxID=1679494 RepID=A0ABR6Q1B7_9FLAO|nr:SIR2 family protein [Chryseobacterium sediminis]MBB6330903.1 hypothetical protein [Chryseobacterium sediminis]